MNFKPLLTCARALRGKAKLFERAFAAALAFLLLLPAIGRAQAPGSERNESEAAEPWSLDDYKDICEAVHFLAITIGIGGGLYWLFARHLPAQQAPRLEFDVDLVNHGEREGTRLIEVVAHLRNLGANPVAITRLRFTVQAVTTETRSIGSGLLGESGGLSALFLGEW